MLKEDVVISKPTGSGKSLVAILPTRFEHGYTVIVLPSLSLIEDWERRLMALNIPFERYRGAAQSTQHLGGLHNIILVTSDVAKGERFRTAIHALHTRAHGRPVLRHIFDEVQHYFLDLDFRKPAFSNPYDLRQFPCQFVLCSATIPIPAQQFLVDAFGLGPTVLYKSSSARPNLLLSIANHCNTIQKQLDAARKIIAMRKQGNWTAKDRYLVFVSSHSDGLEAAKALGLPFYHADSEQHHIRDEVRTGMYGGWLRADPEDGIVTTSAISSGTDYKHVRFTIHIGLPFGLVPFEQQRGRAGRDGDQAWNYLIPRTNPHKEPPVDATYGDMGGIKAMNDMVYFRSKLKYPGVCLTYATTAFIDGKGVTCAEVGSLLVCGPCSDAGIDRVNVITPPQFEASLPWEPEQPASLKRKLEDAFGHSCVMARKRCATELGVKHDDLTSFRRFFLLADTSCGFCLVNDGLPTSHDCLTCPEMSETQRHELGDLKRKIKYLHKHKPNPCWRCHIPSMGEDRLHPPFGKDNPCPNPHLVLGLAYAIFANDDLKMRARNDLQPKMAWDNVYQLAEWISTPSGKGNWNAMALLRWASENLLQTD
ncbi:P-loop containing nucleoside triphosphate hydrolase protein [Mycena leptocephala]|nr:P-loop containing nucleoside triphosphate hydrolase protein [Mycena leptocephala]